ncbi:hypothetical protein PRNP1_000668 [Phytophthora ramorum]
MVLLHVAVIGGGAAGIVAAKCLRDEGHSVIVFEKSHSVGGVWKYNEDITADSCTYKSLRTNLPTAVMQFKGFPFPADVPSYPSHVDVLRYIKSYAEHFKVTDVTRLNSSVTSVRKSGDGGAAWRICVSSTERGEYEEQVDRVVVCNGHFSEPFCATVKGIENFRGTKVHSKSYRSPERYANKTVLIIGRGPSGGEISRELANNGAAGVIVSSQNYVAEADSDCGVQPNNRQKQAGLDHVEADGTVVLTDGVRLPPGSAASTSQHLNLGASDTRVLKPDIDFIDAAGDVHFIDSSSIASPDVIIYCTGYVYSVGNFLPSDLLFPKAAADLEKVGLEHELSVEVVAAAAAGVAVAPTYKQVFSIEDPTLAFIGLPFDTATFQCFELQSVWLSRIFSGSIILPSKPDMYAAFCEEIRQTKPPVRKNIHSLGLKHFPYFTELWTLSKCPIDLVALALFGDAAFLLLNFDNFRSATYVHDTNTGKWIRRFILKGTLTVDVKTF